MNIFCAILSGFFYCIGFAGFVHPAFAWIALVPLLIALSRSTVRQSIWLGWLAGFVAHSFAFYWVQHTIVIFGGLPQLAALAGHLLLAAGQSLQFGLFAWIVRRMMRHIHDAIWGVPLAWVVAEFVYPQLFPSYFANSQYQWTTLVQMADVTGVLGVSALLAFANAVVFVVLMRWYHERLLAWRPVVGMLLLVAVVCSYGIWRVADMEQRVAAAEHLRVGLIQANIDSFAKHAQPRDALAKYIALSLPLQEQGVQMLVWPETAILDPILEAHVPRIPEGMLGGIHTWLLTGMYLEDQRANPWRDYNAAVLIAPDGRIVDRYIKQVLLMFGEYLPMGNFFPHLYDISPSIGRFTPGTSSRPLSWNGRKLGVSICYEGILPRLINRSMREDPQLLVNITNDSWFGDTHEPLIHLALTTFRSVEHHRAMVRATNTGISAVIDPLGRIVQRTGTFETATLTADVPLLSGRTIYARYGDWFGWSSIALAAMVFWCRRSVMSASL